MRILGRWQSFGRWRSEKKWFIQAPAAPFEEPLPGIDLPTLLKGLFTQPWNLGQVWQDSLFELRRPRLPRDGGRNDGAVARVVLEQRRGDLVEQGIGPGGIGHRHVAHPGAEGAREGSAEPGRVRAGERRLPDVLEPAGADCRQQ